MTTTTNHILPIPYHHPKIGMRDDDILRQLFLRPAGGLVGGNDPPAVSERHRAGFDERLEDAGDVGRGFIGLVDDQHVTLTNGADQWRILVRDHAVEDFGL